MPTEAFEQGADIDLGIGVGVEGDVIIKVGGNTFEFLDDLVNHFNEPTGCSAATLGHDKPLEQAGGCAEHDERDGILVDGDLVE